jgi:hypothetical protein
MTGRPINEDRQRAIALGLRTYTGLKHVKCDTTLRYVAGGGCVHCARIIATEQREARKYLQQIGALDVTAKDVEAMAIDNATEIEEEDEDSEAVRQARREASIDELM